METGKTVILLNLDNLYESLYDALNQVRLVLLNTLLHSDLVFGVILSQLVFHRARQLNLLLKLPRGNV